MECRLMLKHKCRRSHTCSACGPSTQGGARGQGPVGRGQQGRGKEGRGCGSRSMGARAMRCIIHAKCKANGKGRARAGARGGEEDMQTGAHGAGTERSLPGLRRHEFGWCLIGLYYVAFAVLNVVQIEM